MLKPLLVGFLLLSATISYFNQEMGIIIDKEMIRNIVDTGREFNVAEARDLLSLALFLYVTILGLIPSILILMVSLKKNGSLESVYKRGLISTIIIALFLGTLFLNYRYYSFFYRQNEDTLVYVTPVFSIVSIKKYLKRKHKEEQLFHVVGTDAHKDINRARKTLGVLVVGETARADHFAVNGYPRQTTPYMTNNPNIFNFSNVHSCGTSTAYSVPCMFSFMNQDEYSPDLARNYSNVLDVLNKSGVNVIWFENNSSCKGVCNRMEEVNFISQANSDNPYYIDGNYYDEVMLNELETRINNINKDTLIVLHTMGSHGPKYHHRFPERLARFEPYCTQSAPQDCTSTEINNAYDNTIVYTDYFLEKVIRLLDEKEKQVDAFMLYISDHGESLGENGVYLHGLPYLIAPEAQTHVPMLSWFSNSFIVNRKIDPGLIKDESEQAFSHDNLSHSLLGLYDVATSLYKQGQDIFFPAKEHKLHAHVHQDKDVTDSHG